MAENTQLVTRGQDYGKVLLPLARQEKSLLFDKVWVRTDVTGKSFYQDQIGKWEMQAKTGLNVDTPANDLNLARTRIDIATYQDARLMDRSTNLQSFTDPLSQASTCITSSVGIQLDKVIYTALGGTSYRGETGENSITFPSLQTVAVNHASNGENTGLTVAKIRRASKMLTAQGVPASDRTLVCSATALEQLLGATEVTSSDYNNVKALVSGDVDTFVGFKFVVLPDGIITKDGEIANYYAFHKTGICVGMLEELFLQVEARADKSYSKQVYYEINVGAGRLEEAKVVLIKGDESVVVD